MVKFKKSIPVMYAIDLKTGHKKREVSRNLQRGNLWMKPKKWYQKNSKSPLYILATYKKDYRIMRLEL